MSIAVSTAIFNALKGLVANRVYPRAFPQVETLQVWPAIRYTIVGDDPMVSVCGSGLDDSDLRIQIDVVSADADELTVLKEQVRAAMENFDPPAVQMPGGFEVFDDDTRTHRAVLEYVIYR